MSESLTKDPYNIIITGVGGQGNVTASRVLGEMLVPDYVVTTGETFGVSQRGGAVVSYLRVSATSVWSPQIPKGRADLVIALEPAEALRVLMEYGNAESHVLVNMRPVYPVGVVTGGLKYPPLDDIKKAVVNLTPNVWFINATDAARKTLGNPILQNMVMLGAVARLGVLPFDKIDFSQAISQHFSEESIEANIKAFEIGVNIINEK